MPIPGSATMKRRLRIDVQHKAAHEPLLGCDVLFISANAIDSLPQVLNDLRAARLGLSARLLQLATKSLP